MTARAWSPPALGPNGEGWVALQVTLIAATAGSAAAGRRWPRRARSLRLGTGAALLLTGAALAGRTVRAHGSAFTPLPRPQPGLGLLTEGVYGQLRHPGYSGVARVALGLALTTSPRALPPAVSLSAVLALKTLREESWLHAHFAGYENYRAQVPQRFW